MPGWRPRRAQRTEDHRRRAARRQPANHHPLRAAIQQVEMRANQNIENTQPHATRCPGRLTWT
eukprot:8252179-Lingulodinium_polyedra.AAC.1